MGSPPPRPPTRRLGRQIALDAISYLGFAISQTKFAVEGSLSDNFEVLGHDFRLRAGVRAITPYKQKRLRFALDSLLSSTKWDRKLLEQTLGLIQSVKSPIPRRWLLAAVYRSLHSTDHLRRPPANVHPSPRARLMLQRVRNTLHETKPLDFIPLPWPKPLGSLAPMQPESDACKVHGFGAVLLFNNVLRFAAGAWPSDASAINIDLLEGLAVLYGVASFADLLSGQRIVLRCDNSSTCFAFNSMTSPRPAMLLLTEAWEALQFHFQFEGLLFHVPGSDNVFADAASRTPSDHLPSHLRRQLAEKGLPYELARAPAVTTALPALPPTLFEAVASSDAKWRARRASHN